MVNLKHSGNIEVTDGIIIGNVSGDTLNINFTDINFSTDEIIIPFGTFYVNPFGWTDVNFSGYTIGSQLIDDNFYQFTGKGIGQIPSFGVSVPSKYIGSVLNIDNLSGSSIINGTLYQDQSNLGGGDFYQNSTDLLFVEPITGEKTSYSISQQINNSTPRLFISKTNNSGEYIDLRLDNNNTGFQLNNVLSDNSASLFTINDNNGDNIFEVKNDGVFIPKIEINFTDTLNFFTDEITLPLGEFYISPLGWVNLAFSGDSIGYQLTSDNHTLSQFTGEGTSELEGLGITFPTEVAANVINVSSGNLSGSTMLNGIVYSDQTGFGGNETYNNQLISVFVDNVTSEKTSYSISQQSTNNNSNNLNISKTNNSGEYIDLRLDNNNTGFQITNVLSDNSASLFTINDNNGDNIFNVTQLQIIMEKVISYDYADDATAAAAGIPEGGIYHTAGVLKIRLPLP